MGIENRLFALKLKKFLILLQRLKISMVKALINVLWDNVNQHEDIIELL